MRARGLLDPAAADDYVTLIEHCGLAGRDGALRIVETYFHPIAASPVGKIVAPAATCLLRIFTCARIGPARRSMLIQLTSFATHESRSRSSLPTDDYGLRRRLGCDHVQRFATRNPESLALAYRELMNAGVLAEHAAFLVRDVASGSGPVDSLLLEVRIDELRVIAVRNEADLLAIVLRRNRQPVLASQFAHLRLQQMPERKLRTGQLLLRQAEKEISLILAWVSTPHQLIAARAAH